MAKIPTTDTLITDIRALQARVALLETALRSAVAYIALAPANPRNGDVWVQTSDNTFRVRINGVSKTVTVT